MMKLGWLLVLCSLSLRAQDVVNNPPLSIEPEDGRQIIKDNAPVGSLVSKKVEINPVDGQLKLEDKKPESKPTPSAVEVKSSVMKEVPTKEVSNKEEATNVSPTLSHSLEKYLQFSFGYLNSKWEKAEPSLDNGSTLTDFRVVSDMNEHNQFGFAIEMIHDTTQEAIPENIRALQYKLFIDHHRAIFTDKLDWMAGLAVSLGDYSIRMLQLNGLGQSVYTKIKSGTLFGVIPSVGVRFYLVDRNSIDISVEYHHYFCKPQQYIGGLALVPRFSFVF